jgi:hypothetical protein
MQQQLTTGGAVFPSWSPDGKKIAFTRPSSNGLYAYDIFVMNSDGTGQVDLTNSLGDDLFPDWKRVSGYARPRGATPTYASLVPAYEECTSPTSNHGAPLSYPSCTGPHLASDYLTVGTPDSNGKRTTMEAYLRMDVQIGNASTSADEADVALTLHANNVFTKTLVDYTGEVRALLTVRITDRDPDGSATLVDFAFAFSVPCVADPDIAVGSSCDTTTSGDAVVPGVITEGKRAIWALQDVRVSDGGADGDADTPADNTLFLAQGVFVP